MVDTLEEKLAASTHRLARGKDKYERLAKILIGVKAGIDHLTEKLSSLRSGEANPVLGTLTSVVVRSEKGLFGCSVRVVYGRVCAYALICSGHGRMSGVPVRRGSRQCMPCVG